jgi:hypothetical protein
MAQIYAVDSFETGSSQSGFDDGKVNGFKTVNNLFGIRMIDGNVFLDRLL